MIINIQYGASVNSAPPAFKTDINQAVLFFEHLIADPITVTLSVDYSPFDSPFAYGVAITTPTVSYAALKQALAADARSADDVSVLNNLPGIDPTAGAGVTLTRAQQKALGLIPSDNTVDAGLTFTSSVNTAPFNYNADQRAVIGKIDFIGVVESAIASALGKLSFTNSPSYSELDLLRYSAPGTIMHANGPAYFSLNGGQTNLNNFNTALTSGFSSDWAASAGPDAFAAVPPTGVRLNVSLTDIRELDALGYDIATGSGRFAEPVLELANFGTAAGGWSSQNQYPRELADVNGDGLDDIVGFGNGGVNVSLATGLGHFAPVTSELANFGVGAGGWSNQNQYPRALADVNGDGLEDIVGFGNGGVNVSLATSGGHFAAPTFELANFGVGAGGWSSQDQYPRLLADVNGDGKADIVAFGFGGVNVSLATGGGHFAAPTFELANFGVGAGGWSNQNQYPRELADVNGDGMADIVAFGNGGVNVSLATGGGHFAAPTFELANFGVGAGGWSSQDQYPRLLADVNGDGMADIVGFGNGGVNLSLATGGGHFAGPTSELGNFGVGAGGWSSQDQYPRALGDVDGDGRADIVGFGAGGVVFSHALEGTLFLM